MTPYAWAINVTGDITVRDRTVEVDASFIDILEESDSLLAWMSYTELRKGRFAFYNDLIWGDFSFSRDTLSDRNPIPGLTVEGVSAGLDYEMLMLEFGAAYEVFRQARGAGSLKDGARAESVTAIDVLAAARYWRQEADLSLNITGEIDIPNLGLERRGNLAFARSDTLEWVDPIIGVRLRYQMPGGHELRLRGDIGGFGVGSDFTWQVFGGYVCEKQVGDWTLAGVLGYRALGFDFSDGEGLHRKELDVILHGPVMGLSLRF